MSSDPFVSLMNKAQEMCLVEQKLPTYKAFIDKAEVYIDLAIW